MKKTGKIAMLGIVMITTISLTGCSSEEKKKAIDKKQNYEIVNSYDYDKTEGAIKNKMTPKELASQILKENVGIDDGKLGYKPVGKDDDNGIFINSAIEDGDGIPQYPAISKADIEKSGNSDLDEYFKSRKQTAYEKLIENRQEALKTSGTQLTDEEKLERQLEERLKEQQKEIENAKTKAKTENSTSTSTK